MTDDLIEKPAAFEYSVYGGPTTYRIWASGKTEGFPDGIVRANRIPAMIATAIDDAKKMAVVLEPDDESGDYVYGGRKLNDYTKEELVALFVEYSTHVKQKVLILSYEVNAGMLDKHSKV